MFGYPSPRQNKHQRFLVSVFSKIFGEMDDTTMNDDDRISQLPEFILHHILSFLDSSFPTSPVDLVRTSVLSKKWFAVAASFPISRFNIERFSTAKRLSGISFEREYIIDKFFKYVDYATTRFCEQNVTSVQTFHLVAEFQSSTQEDIIDRCLGLILKKGVQKFVIDIHGRQRYLEPPPTYRLPNILLSASSIKSLRIRYCVLPSSLMVDVVKFKYLKLLELNDVNISEEGIRYLTTSCPLLEEIYIYRCYGFKRLCIYGLQNLHKVEIYYMPEIEMIDIQAPNLSDLFLLDWKGRQTPPSINLASRKKLTLTSFGYLSKRFVESLSNFPFLENLLLKLSANYINLKLSNPSLRKLVIHSQCGDLDEIKIVTPNLLYFYYTQRSFFPELRNYNESKACMECNPDYYVETIFFQKLRRFLDKTPQFSILKLYISAGFIDVDELKMTEWSPFELEHLDLEVFSTKELSVYVAIVDAVLWCCRPRSVTLRFSIHLNDFEEWSHALKFTYEKLLEQEGKCQTNIRFVLSSSSNAKMHFSDMNLLLLALPNLLMPALPCGQRIEETITFIKDEVGHEAGQ